MSVALAPSDVCRDYTQHVLRPNLSSMGLRDYEIGVVLRSVSDKLALVLANWGDVQTRKALLFPGVEEGTFYSPNRAALDIRALVVVGVRNSYIEDLHADKPNPARGRLQNPHIPDLYLRRLTGLAIQYFVGLDIDALSVGLSPADASCQICETYRKRYPLAWEALYKLANMPAGTFEQQYEPCVSDLPPWEILPQGQNESLPGLGNVLACASGTSGTYDPGLINILSAIGRGGLGAFVFDSFKSVTRNREKLYTIIEFILRCKRSFVGTNYLIEPGYVARRDGLLRPGHTWHEIQGNLENKDGLTARHATYFDNTLYM